MTETLRQKLLSADVICSECGSRYGKYSVGCSSHWMGTCDVCGKDRPVTEVRDYGYLSKGLAELGALKVDPFAKLTESFPPERKAKIKEQSKVVASYMASVGPIMNDDELDGAMMASYEEGELTCKFTEAEVTALAEVLDAHAEEYPPGKNVDYDSAFMKVMELYGDECLTYELSPALKKFYELYGTYGTENDVEKAKWEVFRDAFRAGFEFSKEGAND